MPTEKQMANLLRKEDRTPSERRESARRAGKASGKARAIRKTIAQAVRDQMDPDKIAEVLLKSAGGGNLKAIDMVVDLMGEKAAVKQEISVQTVDKTIEAMEAFFDGHEG